MQHNDDSIAFLDDEEDVHAAGSTLGVWRLLIVDDDEDVHQATEFALRDVEILGRRLEFLHARSSNEAISVLRQTERVAVVLLDVVMESEDAGLKAIGRIRNELGLLNLRIILRTGQPGYAPELDAISSYDINDYKTKSELTRNKLFTAVTAAVRSYDQIERLDASRRGLELIIDGANRFIAEQGLQAFAAGVITQIAALLGVPPEGVMCVCAASDTNSKAPMGERCTVLAAAGRYQEYINHHVAALENHELCDILDTCLGERRHHATERGLALYFPGRQGRNFAAYVESGQSIHEPDRHLLEVFCANIAICGDNVDLVERLRQTAYVDGLTLLPNRAAQIEALDAGGQQGAVLALIDIDQFSETIDAFGYRFGDLQLQAIGRRLRAAMPPDVYLARVGGDVFSLCGGQDVVNPPLLREILADTFDSELGPQSISFSLGFVHVADAGVSGADLLRNAAIALKRAKVDGPGNEAYYTAEVAIQTRERVRLLQNLRQAFDSRRLFVVYQPQLGLPEGKIIGVEALLRWRNDEGQFVPPDQFIPVAEHSGLIIGVGAWVLRTALQAQQKFLAQGFRLRMAVNVSAIQFRHPGFLGMLEEAIAESGIEPSALELEITESVAMYGWGQVQERLQAIKDMGVSVAIDDFGTGFSSLSYLDRLPADCLKIDRSFISSLDASESGARIAEMVIQLGKRLGMRVLAEGVEQVEQLNTLIDLGCDEAQGWYYAKGMPEDELLDWLRQQSR